LEGNLAPDRRGLYIDYLTSQKSSRGNAQITFTNGKSYSLSGVRGTLYLMMASPEYQLN